jgi:hypothetical protein
MYTSEKVAEKLYAILDPDGDHVCFVQEKDEARILLSHLNRR